MPEGVKSAVSSVARNFNKVLGLWLTLLGALLGGALMLRLGLWRALLLLTLVNAFSLIDRNYRPKLNAVEPGRFRVQLIPETQGRTTLAGKRVGDRVNLEADLVGKYVARMAGLGLLGGGLTQDALARAGFGRFDPADWRGGRCGR